VVFTPEPQRALDGRGGFRHQAASRTKKTSTRNTLLRSIILCEHWLFRKVLLRPSGMCGISFFFCCQRGVGRSRFSCSEIGSEGCRNSDSAGHGLLERPPNKGLESGWGGGWRISAFKGAKRGLFVETNGRIGYPRDLAAERMVLACAPFHGALRRGEKDVSTLGPDLPQTACSGDMYHAVPGIIPMAG